MIRVKAVFPLIAGLLLLSACGLKEAPQLVQDLGPPEIADFKYSMEGNGLRMTFKLRGGAGGIGYQVDRAEIDPACDCPSFWRRFYEQPPLANQNGRRQQRTLGVPFERNFAFRIRAVDGLGHLGAWGEVMRVRAEKP
ncbi:MAG: hypothetical protein R8K46_09775 [Mariprofundaceae bacterium]